MGIAGGARYWLAPTKWRGILGTVREKCLPPAVAGVEFRYNHGRIPDIFGDHRGAEAQENPRSAESALSKCVTGAMRALAAVFLIAFFMVLAIFAMGSWSCSQQASPPGGAQQAETTSKKDCATLGGTFVTGFRDSGEFIRAYREETVAIGVVVIAIFTIVLGAFTMAIASSTRLAAAAALLNARAVLEAERARLYVVIERETIGKLKSWADGPSGPDGDDQPIADLEIAYSFRNYGRTPALIHEIGHKVVISQTMPRERAYSVPAPLPIEPAIAAAATSAPITDVDIPNVTMGTAKAIRDSQATFWFYGYVVYDDTYGWRRIFYFEFHYSGSTNGFRLSFCRETEERRR